MKTPASQWTVLVAVLCGIAGGLWVAARAVQPRGNEPRALDDEVEQASTLAPEPACLLANPSVDPRRGLVERPLDEARCGASAHESTLTTRVEDALGQRIEGARLVVFACDANGPRGREFVETRSGQGGRACLKTVLGGEVLVAAYANGFLPTTRRVQAVIGSQLELEPFVLEKGATIEGTVRIGGEPLARAEVEIVACPTCDVIDLGGVPFAWRQDHFVRAKATVETDSEGRYEINGLERTEHSVNLRTVRRRDVAIDVSKAGTVRVEAPAKHVDFALPAARLELRFLSNKAPLCCVEVQIEAGDRQFTRTADEEGRLAVLVQPALAYPLITTRRGYETRRVQLRGLIDGERYQQTIELDPQEALASVIIDDEGRANDESASFTFKPRFPLMHGSAFERTVRRDPQLGAFLLADVPSGAWSVTMRSGRMIRGTSTSKPDEPLAVRENCDADALVTVPDSGTVRTLVFPRKLYPAMIVARDRFGVRVAERFKVFDARGEEVDAVVVAPARPLSSAESPDDVATSLVYPTVCGGPLELAIFAEGFATQRIPNAFGGTATPFDVVLDAR